MRSDKELMEAAKQGDLEAYERIVNRHRQEAWQVAYRLLDDTSEAEDMAQSAFVKIFEAIDRYEPTASFRTYLYRVVTRLCYDRIEKRGPVHVNPLDGSVADTEQTSPEKHVVNRERKLEISEALDSLPRRQKVAIVLQHYEDRSYSEIAEIMDTTTKAVERLVARARDALKELLEHESARGLESL